MIRVLDYGCGDINDKYGFYSDKKHIIYGVDINKEDIQNCKKRYPEYFFDVIQSDGMISYRDESFDVVQTLDVLEHVQYLDNTVSEISRVLKKGGKLIVEIPYWKSEKFLLWIRKTYRKEVGHVRMFKDNQIEKIFDERGFVCIKKRKTKFLSNVAYFFIFRFVKIINQKGDIQLGGSKITHYIKKIYSIILKLFYPLFYIFDQIFPKSICYEFKKIV